MPTTFFFNIGKVLFLWSLCVMVYLLCLAANRFIKKEIPFARKIQENAGEFFFNLYRVTMVEFIITIMLQLSNVNFSIGDIAVSSAFAISRMAF
jgi:hypothetical protein